MNTNDYYQAISQRDNLREEFNTMMEYATSATSKHIKAVTGRFSPSYPRQQYFSVFATEEVSDNGLYIKFKVDLTDKTVEVDQCGAIHVCEEDKRRSGVMMVNLKTLVKARGGKWMRKSKYKDYNDLCNRVVRFHEDVMAIVEEYTGGYPYAKGLTSVYRENK